MQLPAKWIKATPDELVSDVAKRSLHGGLKPVQHYLPLAARSAEDNVEYVHQLRVWSRRAQAALQMYRELLPNSRAAWVEKQLKRIRSATNDARDDDVFANRLMEDKANAGGARLLERVRTHRFKAQKQVLEVYKRLKRKGRFDRCVAKLLKHVRLRGKQKGKKPKFGKWAEPRLRLLVCDFFEAGQEDLSANDKLHKFRIAGKKLRYAIEFLSSDFPDELRSEVYPLLSKLQEKLGEVNDHATAQARIQYWIDEDDQPKGVDYLQDMLEYEQKQLIEKRTAFFAWWTPDRAQRMQTTIETVLPIGTSTRKNGRPTKGNGQEKSRAY